MDETLIISICVAGAVTLLVLGIARAVLGDRDTRLQRRLGENPEFTGKRNTGKATGIAARVLQAASKPFTPTKRERQSKLRRQLGQAGIYSSTAAALIAGAKAIFLFGGLGLGYMIGNWTDNVLLGVSLGGLVGYVLPTFWLLQKMKSNKKQLNLSLPDALDLMVVCIEAGLTVDSAM